jgi:hypothetical protein
VVVGVGVRIPAMGVGVVEEVGRGVVTLRGAEGHSAVARRGGLVPPSSSSSHHHAQRSSSSTRPPPLTLLPFVQALVRAEAALESRSRSRTVLHQDRRQCSPLKQPFAPW